MEIEVLKDILGANDQIAHNTLQLMDKRYIFEVYRTTSQGIACRVSWLLTQMGRT